ncbi:unnamed protein product [Linum trigynum]|uniref:Uncharacterized protein n=1 Tax=Linum trigynum TaxID=586398 RepID=A0AAV2DZ10_9ROSI
MTRDVDLLADRTLNGTAKKNELRIRLYRSIAFRNHEGVRDPYQETREGWDQDQDWVPEPTPSSPLALAGLGISGG